jgi:alpha-tubulin suppressor-like RCC1 family protein
VNSPRFIGSLLLLLAFSSCVAPTSKTYVAPKNDALEPSSEDGAVSMLDVRSSTDSARSDATGALADLDGGSDSSSPVDAPDNAIDDAATDRPVSNQSDTTPSLDGQTGREVAVPTDARILAANGAQCSSSDACASEHCVDGVCCESACTGQCEACAESGQPGKCVAVTGTPRTGRTSCLGAGGACAGTCNGTNRNTCAYPGTEKECATASCQSGISSTRSLCNGQGVCPPSTMVTCAPFMCEGTICGGGCGPGSPCAADSYCDGGRCYLKKGSGAICTDTSQCASGSCADGVCCDGACSGACMACNTPGNNGHCVAVKSVDDDHCSGASSCDAAGACKKRAGTDCNSGAECSTTSCVDGRCCSSPSCGTCQACTGGGGICVAVMGSADPDSCTGASACNSAGACKKAAGSDCGGAAECATSACVDGKCCSSSSCGTCQVCTGAGGSCVPVKSAVDPDSCAAGMKCDGTGTCKKDPGQACSQSTECALGNCIDGKCCDQSCSGSCQSCSSGTCQAVKNAVDADTCVLGCDSNGACGAASGSIKYLSAGYNHTCALLATGAVRCWGWHSVVGYGNTNDIGDSEHPFTAGEVNVGGSVKQTINVFQPTISSGNGHTCVVLDNGKVRCWGLGRDALGYGNMNDIGDDETPSSVGDVMLGALASAIYAQSGTSCALRDTSAVQCWGHGGLVLGYRSYGNIGDGSIPSSYGAVMLGGTATQIAPGLDQTCALLSSGAVKCWGFGIYGGLGTANTETIGDDEFPFAGPEAVIGGTVSQIVSGDDHVCALLQGGAVRCWGQGLVGQLGHGNKNNIGDDETPASAGDVPLGGPAKQLAAGGLFTCALMTSGNVRCWGWNSSGQLGYGHKNNIGDDETPASAGDVSLGGTAAQITAGGEHACALMTTGAVRCWGNGAYGALGYGNTNNIGDDEIPSSVGEVRVLQ